VVGTHTNPRHAMVYDEGEVRHQFSIFFTARLGGEPKTGSEARRSLTAE